MLARIDRRSGAVLTTGPFSGARTIAADSSWVWIGGDNGYPATPSASQTGLVRLSSTTLDDQLSIPLPGPAMNEPAVAELAAWDQGLWLAYGQRLYRLMPANGAVLTSTALSGTASSLAYDSTTNELYVGSNVGPNESEATVSERDPVNLNQVAVAPTGGAALGGPHIAVGQNDLWISYATGMLGQVEHRRAPDLSLIPMAGRTEFSNSVSVFVVGRYVWVSDAMAGKLDCLDPISGTVRATRELINGGLVVGDASGMYVGDANGVSVLTASPDC